MKNGTFGSGHYGVAPEVKQEPPATTGHNGTFGYGYNRVAHEVKKEPLTTLVHHHANAFIADQSEEDYFEDANFLDQQDKVLDSGIRHPVLRCGRSPNTQDMIMSYARLALHEFVKKAQCGAPLWKPSVEPNTLKLNLVEYYRVSHPMDPNLENSRKRERNRLPSLSSKETECHNISTTRLTASFIDLVRFLQEVINSFSGDIVLIPRNIRRNGRQSSRASYEE